MLSPSRSNDVYPNVFNFSIMSSTTFVGVRLFASNLTTSASRNSPRETHSEYEFKITTDVLEYHELLVSDPDLRVDVDVVAGVRE